MQARSAIDGVCKGAYVALNSTTFTGLSGLYLYRVPQGTACPYAVVQPVTETKMDCFNAPGKDVPFYVHVVSDKPGSERFTILDAAVRLLDYSASFATTSHIVMDVQYESCDPYQEEDESNSGVVYYHAVGMFRAHVWQTS